MKKTVTPKKIKFMTVEVPKEPAPTSIETILGALKSLEVSIGWSIITNILNDNIKFLEQAIINKIDPVTQETLSDSEIEILRIKRNLNIDLRDTPKNYSKVIQDTSEVPENYDPYYTSHDEMMKDLHPVREERGK